MRRRNDAGMPPFDRAKLRELVLYIASKLSTDDAFGATKLNKILFFSDFLAFGNLGRPITGATYQRLDHGPVARELAEVRQDLETRDEAVVAEADYFGFRQKRLVPLRQPKLELFSGPEVALVDSVIDALRTRNATEVSALSHLEMGWQLAQDLETIPYETVFLSGEPVPEQALKRGQRIATELNLLQGV